VFVPSEHALQPRPTETPPVLATIAHHLLFGLQLALTWPLVLLSEWLPLGRANPAFDPSRAEIRAELRRMRADPTPLERPVVVLGGYKAWPVMAGALRGQLVRLTSQEPGDIIDVSYTLRGDIDKAVAIAIDRIERAFPSADPDRTREVDVVGISMGGLVARRAAMDRGGKRLRIRRLFTLASPHGGAKLAERIRPDRASRDMRAGSAFLDELDRAWPGTADEVYPYAVLNDTWVGATRTMPPGHDGALWTRGSVVASHFTVSANRRIVADIALRLRGEPPLSGAPSPPLSD
jgi:hypothetical protein